MKEIGGLPRDYRDLVGFIGVGPKVALVTLQETIGVVQGVPCDVYICVAFLLNLDGFHWDWRRIR